MILHVLRFRFRDDVDERERDDVLADLRRLAAADSVTFSVVGQDVGDPSEGYTHGYCVAVEDFDALRRYQYHPEHRAIAKRFASRVAALTGLDVSDDTPSDLSERIRAMFQAWLADDPELADLLEALPRA